MCNGTLTPGNSTRLGNGKIGMIVGRSAIGVASAKG
jgi:hypothetical protein